MPTIYENEGHRRSSIKNYHRFVWRLAEWRRDPRCRYCQKVMHNRPDFGTNEHIKDKATLDHAIARGLGGSDTEDNFLLLCGNCNSNKSKIENKLLSYIQKSKQFEKNLRREKQYAKMANRKQVQED